MLNYLLKIIVNINSFLNSIIFISMIRFIFLFLKNNRFNLFIINIYNDISRFYISMNETRRM